MIPKRLAAILFKSKRESFLLLALFLSNAFWIFSSQQACGPAAYYSRLPIILPSAVAKNSTNATAGASTSVSKNEAMYDKKYWEWQASLNKFGAAYKGDIIRHLIQPQKTTTKILEFGCSGGYILDSMSAVGGANTQLYGVEINPASRDHATNTFSKSIQDVFLRPEDIADDMLFDVIYTSSVLEHVDSPLAELRKLKSKLQPDTGILIVGLKNDGADFVAQTFDATKNDPNHHIYTWNALLLTNMLSSAGYTPCNTIGQLDAWHDINVDTYHKDKHDYCTKGLQVGKENNVHNLWAIAVPDNAIANASCQMYHKQLQEILNCQYLKGF
jgi:2-polyprenyl-3-methyl-5-hydroxy-6-metoxy-1,4-benzoquinol methylase